jgi:DNA-binding NtrC family response regulator
MEQLQSHSPRAVLVVEDDPFVRLDAVDIVTDAGLKAYEAGDADEAIRLMEAHDDIGVLFTDVEMPGSMNGLKLAQAVHRRWPPVAIIIASGQLRLYDNDMPDESAFFAKPYCAEQIAGKLQEMVGRPLRG